MTTSSGESSSVRSPHPATPETQSQLVSAEHPSRHSLGLGEDFKKINPNLSVASENLHQKNPHGSSGHSSFVHSNMKQRYLEEIQAAKTKSGIGVVLEDQEPKEEPNIFFHSLSDRNQQPADQQAEEEDPKLEQKLFKLAYRKRFRTKA